jgi:hypothetical protein
MPPHTKKTRSNPEILNLMLDVHAPHQSVHTWKDFSIHIAAITIGLLIALGLEATVEWVHHRHQAQQALERLKQEFEQNRVILQSDIRSGDIGARNHRAALGVLRRLRAGTLRPEDRLIYVRMFQPFGSTAWTVTHESGAAAYIPYEMMERYDDLYAAQQRINDTAISVNAQLQMAASVLNTEVAEQNSADEEAIQREAESVDNQSVKSGTPDSGVDGVENEINAKLSGHPDLLRLTPAQIDRLEQGFQEAIANDRQLRRFYVSLGILYASLAK